MRCVVWLSLLRYYCYECVFEYLDKRGEKKPAIMSEIVTKNIHRFDDDRTAVREKNSFDLKQLQR